VNQPHGRNNSENVVCPLSSENFSVGVDVTNSDEGQTGWFAVDEEVQESTAESTKPKQDRRAPIKIVGGRAWSPGIYQALRQLGKSLDVAWEKVFIRPLTFNI
jgi:hypothetical protein